MVQLKVYDGTDQYFLDLYEEETIKLNMSIEDITNAEAKSVFSRAFRVPATGNNNQFFKHAFMISGIDYDVTVKKPADILVNGADFRSGHVRLQKIYVNGDQDKIDYEIIFMGVVMVGAFSYSILMVVITNRAKKLFTPETTSRIIKILGYLLIVFSIYFLFYALRASGILNSLF